MNRETGALHDGAKVDTKDAAVGIGDDWYDHEEEAQRKEEISSDITPAETASTEHLVRR